MNLARALAMVPREIRTTRGYEWTSEGMPPKKIRWTAQIRRELACVVILARGLACPPRPWKEIEGWLALTHGISQGSRPLSSTWSEWMTRRGGVEGINRVMAVEYTHAAGIIWAIGQVTTPVSWQTIADWIEAQTGMVLSRKALSDRVTRYAQGRSRSHSATRHQDVAQAYIVAKLHGAKNIWPTLAKWAGERRGRPITADQLCAQTLRYMHEVMG